LPAQLRRAASDKFQPQLAVASLEEQLTASSVVPCLSFALSSSVRVHKTSKPPYFFQRSQTLRHSLIFHCIYNYFNFFTNTLSNPRQDSFFSSTCNGIPFLGFLFLYKLPRK
jgi:hypothetical protein